jgi:hypothetical protein
MRVGLERGGGEVNILNRGMTICVCVRVCEESSVCVCVWGGAVLMCPLPTTTSSFSPFFGFFEAKVRQEGTRFLNLVWHVTKCYRWRNNTIGKALSRRNEEEARQT